MVDEAVYCVWFSPAGTPPGSLMADFLWYSPEDCYFFPHTHQPANSNTAWNSSSGLWKGRGVHLLTTSRIPYTTMAMFLNGCLASWKSWMQSDISHGLIWIWTCFPHSIYCHRRRWKLPIDFSSLFYSCKGTVGREIASLLGQSLNHLFRMFKLARWCTRAWPPPAGPARCRQ